MSNRRKVALRMGLKTSGSLLVALCLFPSGMANPVAAQSPATNPVLPAAVPDDFVAGLELDAQLKASLRSAIQAKDYKRAEQMLLTELSRNPRSTHARAILILLGNIYFLDTDYTQAILAWIKADAIVSLDDRTRFQLATTEIHLNHSDWARKQLEILARSNPTSALYQYWLARLDYDAQQYSSAIARLEGVVQLDPKLVRAYDLLGLCYDYLGDTQKAIEQYTKAVSFNREQPHPSSWPPLDFAITLMNAGRPEDAEAALHEAIKFDPGNSRAHYQLGVVLDQKGDMQGAIGSLSHATELDPTYAEPHFALARIYRRLGDREKSQREVDIFVRLHTPTTPAADPRIH
jgi:tetratricopeptide (TPR) repeat protein